MLHDLVPALATAPLETSGTNWTMIALGALVVVAVLGAIWWLFLRKSGSGE